MAQSLKVVFPCQLMVLHVSNINSWNQNIELDTEVTINERVDWRFVIDDSHYKDIDVLREQVWRYKLISVVNHAKRGSKTVYTTYSLREDEWYEFDDNLYVKAEIKDVKKLVTKNTSMLFYQKLNWNN